MDYWTIILAIVAYALYYYLYKHNHFKRAGIPHIPPVPIFGNLAPVFFRQISMPILVQNVYNLNPEAKYVGFFDMAMPVIILRDLELMKSIAVTNFDHFPNRRGFADERHEPLFTKNIFALRDDKWKYSRTLFGTVFTAKKMKEMFKMMSHHATEFADFMSKIPAEKKELKMRESFARCTNDVLAKCAFGITVDTLRNPNNDFYIMGKEAMTLDELRSLKLLTIRNFPRLTKLFNVKFIPEHASEFFINFMADMIKTREQMNIQRSDMIQVMIQAKDNKVREMNIMEMTGEVLAFISGGVDNAALMLSFVTYALAVNPDVQAKTQSEIDDVLERTNGEPTYEAIKGMAYLDAVVNETLRMYPFVHFFDRICAKDFELPPVLPGAKPFTVKKGMCIWFPVYGVQHDPKYYENPDTFDPDRFLGENKTNLNNGTYFPFGIGPRMCIGNRFALLEIKVVLFHLLARCDLKPCKQTCIPMEFSTKGAHMVPVNGFWLKVMPRDKPSKISATNGTVTNGVAVH